MTNAEPTIPIIRVMASGREMVIGCASNMESAARLLDQFAQRYGTENVYVDCARTVRDARLDYRADKAFGWTA